MLRPGVGREWPSRPKTPVRKELKNRRNLARTGHSPPNHSHAPVRSFRMTGPKKQGQNNRPYYSPAHPGDVRVGCLPFQDILVEAHFRLRMYAMISSASDSVTTHKYKPIHHHARSKRVISGPSLRRTRMSDLSERDNHCAVWVRPLFARTGA